MMLGRGGRTSEVIVKDILKLDPTLLEVHLLLDFFFFIPSLSTVSSLHFTDFFCRLLKRKTSCSSVSYIPKYFLISDFAQEKKKK